MPASFETFSFPEADMFRSNEYGFLGQFGALDPKNRNFQGVPVGEPQTQPFWETANFTSMPAPAPAPGGDCDYAIPQDLPKTPLATPFGFPSMSRSLSKPLFVEPFDLGRRESSLSGRGQKLVSSPASSRHAAELGSEPKFPIPDETFFGLSRNSSFPADLTDDFGPRELSFQYDVLPPLSSLHFDSGISNQAMLPASPIARQTSNAVKMEDRDEAFCDLRIRAGEVVGPSSVDLADTVITSLPFPEPMSMGCLADHPVSNAIPPVHHHPTPVHHHHPTPVHHHPTRYHHHNNNENVYNTNVYEAPPAVVVYDVSENVPPVKPKARRGRARRSDAEVHVDAITEINVSLRALSDLPSDLHNRQDEDRITIGKYSKVVRRAKIHRFKQKRLQQAAEPKVLYKCRKRFADARPRVGGRFVKLHV